MSLGRGDPVLGSQFYRDFCAHCYTPMRVQASRIEHGVPAYCGECEPCASKDGERARRDDAEGRWLNAIRQSRRDRLSWCCRLPLRGNRCSHCGKANASDTKHRAAPAKRINKETSA